MFGAAFRITLVLVLASGFAGCGKSRAAEPDGAALFARHCASCHGAYGEGDGPVAEVMLGAIPNLRSLSSRAGGEFPRDAVMAYIDGRDLPAAHGERLMPVWGDTFTDEEGSEDTARERIRALTDFVEKLQN
jgi:mono/diheme cytochrome c family protein